MLKRSMFTLAALLLAVPMFAGSVAYGQTAPSTSNNTTTNDSTEAPETPEQQTARTGRITQLKELQKIKLAVAEKKNILGKCQAAQGKVASLGGRIKGIETSRGEVDKNVVDHLNDLVARLKAKGVDTTGLQADITVLSTKIKTFNTDLATYKQAVSDLRALDCKTDPEGFKAALVAARADLETVKADNAAVKAYLKDTIRPLLVTLRGQLATSTGGTLQTQNNNGGTQ